MTVSSSTRLRSSETNTVFLPTDLPTESCRVSHSLLMVVGLCYGYTDPEKMSIFDEVIFEPGRLRSRYHTDSIHHSVPSSLQGHLEMAYLCVTLKNF